MATTVPRELMILVERIVRPLPLLLSRRMRTREELLAHAQAIYDEELARDPNADAALARVRERLGDPQQLSKELRETIRPREVWLAWSQSLVEQQPALSTGAFSLRLAAGSGILMAFLFACALAIRQFVGEPVFEAEIRLFIALVIGQSVWLGFFLYWGLQAGAAWDHAPRRWTVVVAAAIGLFILPSFNWSVLIAFVTGEAIGNLPSLPAILIAGTLTMVGGIAVGVLHHRERARCGVWSELDLTAV